MAIKILFILGFVGLGLSSLSTLLNHLGLASRILEFTYLVFVLETLLYFIKLYEKN